MVEVERREAVTGPAVVQDNPMLRLQYYKETGQSDQAKQYEQYLRETNQYRDAAPAPRPSMAGRVARENANDAEAQAVPETGYLGRLVTHVLNAAQGIPGMEAFEAGAGALGSHLTSHPLSYQESLNT